MERFFVGLLVAASLEKMDRCHRRSHQGIVITAQEGRHVQACREFLNWFEKVGAS